MPYEVVDPENRDHEGVIYPTLTAAMVEASPRLEVWELADDTDLTRTVKCWPDPEFEPAELQAGEHRHEVVQLATARAERVASELLAEYPISGYEQTVALLALAYATGERAGAAQALAEAERGFMRALKVMTR